MGWGWNTTKNSELDVKGKTELFPVNDRINLIISLVGQGNKKPARPWALRVFCTSGGPEDMP
jgi:hypothetical protein